MIDPWYEHNIVCPRDHLPLKCEDGNLVCQRDHHYPVVDGMPVLLLDDVPQTMRVADASLQRARCDDVRDARAPHLYLESLGIGEEEKSALVKFASEHSAPSVDPVVQYILLATNGHLYGSHRGRLESYPIPDIRLPPGHGKRLLDVGCSWGRWSVAAGRKGYDVIGLDPSLGAVMAARRVHRQLGLTAHFVVADARYLPFPRSAIDIVFSYSVLQHLSDEHVEGCLREAHRVLRPGGICCVQMASAFGLRSLYHQMRRGFRAAKRFEVRYRTPYALRRLFDRWVGKSRIEVDCYFGLGLQAADAWMMTFAERCLIYSSELLRRMSQVVAPLKYLADSLYLRAVKSD